MRYFLAILFFVYTDGGNAKSPKTFFNYFDSEREREREGERGRERERERKRERERERDIE